MMWDVKHRYKSIFYLFIGICLICTGCDKEQSADLQNLVIEDTNENETDLEDENEKSENQELQLDESLQNTEENWIYVCGAVNEPGVYTFSSQVHICEVIEKAGGFRTDAATTYLNQAQLVGDGEQIYVPTQQEVDEGTVPGDSGTQKLDVQQDSGDGRVNINTATKEELMTLTGIGELKAESIISYREAQGTFQSVEDIMQVDGIKEGTFNKIKDNITV